MSFQIDTPETQAWSDWRAVPLFILSIPFVFIGAALSLTGRLNPPSSAIVSDSPPRVPYPPIVPRERRLDCAPGQHRTFVKGGFPCPREMGCYNCDAIIPYVPTEADRAYAKRLHLSHLLPA